jgi:outer membrane protein OmpA-like peptidoglycan-associated protein/LysM repeat protein
MKKTLCIVFVLISSWLYSQSSDRFTVKGVSINTNNNEFGTVISNDGGVFYSKSTYKNQMDLGEISSSLYKGEILSKGEISKGLKFPTDAIHAVFTNDGGTVYYSKKEGDKFQLYKAQVDNTGRWKNNIKLLFNDPNFNFKQPALNKDNTKLFFVSDKSDTFGSTDIYYVIITNHGLNFSDPIHLNFYVNTPGEEIFPHIGDLDKLYFSSDGMSGLGGLDIFESFYNNGAYENTANLGEPINSEFDDFAFTLISNNYKGFFSSNRNGGSGGVDIYYFEDKKPTLNKCSKSLSGFVKNKENQKPIAEATVEMFDSNGNNENTLTDDTGAFVFDNVECEATYDIVSYKEGFNGIAEVHTSPLNTEVINLYLNPEFPEGFKEEYDFSNEITVIDTPKKETNKEVASAEKTETQKKQAEQNIQAQLAKEQALKERQEMLAEAKKTSEKLKEEPKKAVVVNDYDPLDYDPQTQPKKAVTQNTTQNNPKTEVKKEVAQQEWDPLDYDPQTQPKAQAKKEVAQKEWDPLDYDPQTQPKKVTKTEPVAENSTENKVNPVVDYDPLDYDPHSQTKTEAQKKAELEQSIKDAQAKKESAEQERQRMIAEAKATSEKLKKDQEVKQLADAQAAEAKKLEVEKNIAAQKQAVVDAKKRDEQEKLEREQLAAANNERLKQAEATRIENEKLEKARIESERQTQITAQKEAVEQERQRMIAEAKATSENLKKEEESKQLAKVQEAEAIKLEAEKNLALQKQAVADAKKRDEQEKLEREQLATANIEKMKQAELAKVETAKQEKDRIEAERLAQIAAQKEAVDKERQRMIAEAKATSEQLKKEEEAKQLATTKEVETTKTEVVKDVTSNTKTEITSTETKNAYHTVQKGEGLYSIAKNNNLTVAELKKINGLTSDNISVGQKLQVTKTVPEDVALVQVDVNEKTTQDPLTYVQKETEKQLTPRELAEMERQQRIAEAKATSEQLKQDEAAKQLAQAQEAEAEKLEIEKNLAQQKQAIIDAKKRDEEKQLAQTKQTNDPVTKTFENPSVSENEAVYHTVKKGEGLYSIAKNNNLTVAELKKINGLTSDNIKEGQSLLVSKKQVTNDPRDAYVSTENPVKTKVEDSTPNNPVTQQQNNQNAQKEVAEQERQRMIAEAKATSERIKKEEEARLKAEKEKVDLAVKEKTEPVTPVVSEMDEGKSEQENLEARIEANKLAKKQAEEKARLDRIEKAKATAEKLKKEKEQNQVAQTNPTKVTSAQVKNNPVTDSQATDGNCSKNINGYIKNSITKKNLSEVKIDLYYEGQNIETASSNTTGEFFFYNVDCNTKYTLICYKEGFDNIAKAVIDTKSDPKDVTILLEPNKENAVAANIKNEVNQDPVTYVPKKVDPTRPVEDKRVIVEDTRKKEDDGMTYYVKEAVIEMPKIEEGKVILNPIYFDLDEWYLTLPARRELDKIILLMKTNPSMIIESGSHTDTQGSFDYNLILSEKRSQETIGYLIANGADPDRISGRGYGETMPVNHCLDGVKCTQKEHLENRRTEFVILRY